LNLLPDVCDAEAGAGAGAGICDVLERMGDKAGSTFVFEVGSAIALAAHCTAMQKQTSAVRA